MKRLKELMRQILREHSSPRRLAVAVGVGILVGCSPFYGLHVWIGLALSVVFRLNKVAVFLGSQISIPPVAPFIAVGGVQIGAALLTGGPAELPASGITWATVPTVAKEFFFYWLVGGLVLGTLLAVPGAVLTAYLVRRRSRVIAQVVISPSQPPAGEPWHAVLRGLCARFASTRRGHRHYARAKLQWDPVYRQLWDRLCGTGRVLDLGSGIGLLPALLAGHGGVQEVTGIEWDAAKVATARQACSALPAARIVQGDVRDEPFPRVDAVVMVDLLHYFPVAEQDAILARAAAALAPGGWLVIRETERASRAWLTRWLEAVAMRTGWNKGPQRCYRTAAEWQGVLETLGLEVARAASSSAVHRGNVLIFGRRPLPAS